MRRANRELTPSGWLRLAVRTSHFAVRISQFAVACVLAACAARAPGGRNVLVDAGFYREKFVERWRPVAYEQPSAALRRIGLRPEDVTDVVVSHVHWDHLDGADLFPNARIWIQRAEFEHYVDGAGRPRAAAI